MPNKEDLKEKHALRRRRRLRQLLGAAVCFLVVVGAVSLVSSGVGLVAQLFDDTDERNEFASRLNTLVALDPVPFNDLSEANQSTLLSAAIWASIDTVNNEYERDENGSMYLPTLDIDKTAAALYGPDFKFTYDTFIDHDLTYEYVPEKQAYLLPITSAINDYSPLVTKIKRESGGVKRVTVGYVNAFSAAGEFNPNAAPEPVKYQDYLFRKGNDGYYLYAIVESETKVSTSASADSSQPNFGPENLIFQEALREAVESTPSSGQSASGAAPASEAAVSSDSTAE